MLKGINKLGLKIILASSFGLQGLLQGLNFNLAANSMLRPIYIKSGSDQKTITA